MHHFTGSTPTQITQQYEALNTVGTSYHELYITISSCGGQYNPKDRYSLVSPLVFTAFVPLVTGFVYKS